MMSFGQEGLIQAARRFDPSRGVPFAAYARNRVRFAMIDSVRKRDKRAAFARSMTTLPFGMQIAEGGRVPEPPDHRSGDPGAAMARKDAWEWIRQRIGCRDARILYDYFAAGETMQEIGDRLGLSQAWVSAIIKNLCLYFRNEIPEIKDVLNGHV